MKTYKTATVASIVGYHPNTIRLYETWGLITPPKRLENGYRVYTDLHIHQIELAKTALAIPVLQNGLRKKAMNIIKACATLSFDKALMLTKEYIAQVEEEIHNAKEAIAIVEQLLTRKPIEQRITFTRKQTATYLHISIDTLRNWELNGLLLVKRKKNGYRIYTQDDIQRLKIIKVLRLANYSLSAILRLLSSLDKDPNTNISTIMETTDNTDIISVYDTLLISLNKAKNNALSMVDQITYMKSQF